MEFSHLRNNRFCASLLAYLGLIPFFTFLAIALIHPSNYMAIMAFCYYSAGISAFLAGTFWQYDRLPAKILVQSNLMVLLVFIGLILLHIQAIASLMILSLVFCWALTVDLTLGHIDWYWHLRRRLSAIVVICHCLLLAHEIFAAAH